LPADIRGFRRESDMPCNETTIFFDGEIIMEAKERSEEWTSKLESYLGRACEAEAAHDFEKAERFFKYALFYEGKLLPDVSDAKQYVAEAGPVYEKLPVAVGADDLAVAQN
jgi:hypothetical protein